MEQQKSEALATMTGPGPIANPFTRQQSEHLAVGAVAIESERAIAEAQGKLVIAKKFPRDPHAAFEKVRDACKRTGLAREAFYTYERGGSKVTGPSIRLAEELARCWGNVDYGLRELSNREGVSEMEAYAWDMETNTVSKQQFTVKHVRDTRAGSKQLNDQRDIYELGANMGARRMRARILAILPADFVDAAIEECKATIARGTDGVTVQQRAEKMKTAFAALGVTAKALEEKLGHAVGQITADELVELQGIYTSIRDGQSKAADHFAGPKIEEPKTEPKKKAAPKAEEEPKKKLKIEDKIEEKEQAVQSAAPSPAAAEEEIF